MGFPFAGRNSREEKGFLDEHVCKNTGGLLSKRLQLRRTVKTDPCALFG